jgi:signal transduction histidine kinase
MKYYLFSTMPIESFTDYVLKLVLFFFAAATSIVLLIVLPSVYFAIKRLLAPVKDMTIAARRFGEGDFSKKLYIAQQNELGFLANSLNEMANSLQALDENRRSFVSNVSHEFKTPLTTIAVLLTECLTEQFLRICTGIISKLFPKRLTGFHGLFVLCSIYLNTSLASLK